MFINWLLGLFAKIDIPPNTVVSFYNGTRNPDLTKDKEWYQNKNAIQLDDVTVIDVPVPHDSTDNYTASLGTPLAHSVCALIDNTQDTSAIIPFILMPLTISMITQGLEESSVSELWIDQLRKMKRYIHT